MRPFWPAALAACLAAVLLMFTVFRLTQSDSGGGGATRAYLARLRPVEIEIQTVRQKLRAYAKGAPLDSLERARLASTSASAYKTISGIANVPQRYSRYHEELVDWAAAVRDAASLASEGKSGSAVDAEIQRGDAIYFRTESEMADAER